jgi:hypothetical protein
MAYNRLQAARLLSATELPVFEASLGSALGAHTAAQLRALVKRARTMRDKAQDLHRRQRVASRASTGSKAGTSGLANQRTAQKQQALGEALARLEQRLAQLEAAAERAAAQAAKERERLAAAGRKVANGAAAKATAAKRPARSAKAPAAGPTPNGPGLPPASPGARDKGMLQQRKFTGSQGIQAHVGASGRRQQARRDSKR